MRKVEAGRLEEKLTSIKSFCILAKWMEDGVMIVKRKDGYHVISEKTGKNLGGPYKTRAEAAKRLKQVEYFKHRKA
jgi:hypothetical protein